MKQTQMYVCALEEYLFLVDVVTLLYKYEVIRTGNWTGIHTIATRDEKCDNYS